jgi:hypothetical protein
MAIRHKRKNSAGYTWQTGDLVEGQIGLNIADGTLHFDKADGSTVTIAAGSSGITDVVQDTTPQLGGNLDVNGNSIVSTSNSVITIAPNGTGDIQMVAGTTRFGLGNLEATLTTNGTGNLVLRTNQGGTSGNITINQGADANIEVNPNGTGNVNLNADTVRIGDSGSEAVLTTNGTGGLRISTNDNSTTGYIALNSGAGGHITLEPEGTGQVFVNASTLRVGDVNAQATVTSNGTGNLVLNTNQGTTTGSITIAQGANGQITIAPNGTGVTVITGSTIGAMNSSANNAVFVGRHIVTASASDTNFSFNAQKQRSDILFAAMTDEPAVYAFGVRDSGSNNRVFGRWIGRYAGPSANPVFTLRGSPDGFTTNIHYMSLGGGVGTFGATSNAYTITSNTGGALNLTANNNTTSGTITIASSTNADITVTPNGTGKTVISNIVPIEFVYTAGATTGTIAPDAALGTIQSITLTGNITFNAFTTPIAGETITMIITQPASGGPYTLTSTMKFAGASKTLSTAANAVDILSVTYDGTNYWASLSKGYA